MSNNLVEPTTRLEALIVITNEIAQTALPLLEGVLYVSLHVFKRPDVARLERPQLGFQTNVCQGIHVRWPLEEELRCRLLAPSL